jgi:hypothetical protein
MSTPTARHPLSLGQLVEDTLDVHLVLHDSVPLLEAWQRPPAAAYRFRGFDPRHQRRALASAEELVALDTTRRWDPILRSGRIPRDVFLPDLAMYERMVRTWRTAGAPLLMTWDELLRVLAARRA